jgi:hypothetical protein
MTRKQTPVCRLQTVTAAYTQEVYETSTGHARRRADQLRRAGFEVQTVAMGPQVTSVGTVRMTLVDIRTNGREVPFVVVNPV